MGTGTVASTSNPLQCLRHAAGTDIGRRREENQDAFGIIENRHARLYVVCDGMGGAKGGRIASNLAIDVLRDCFREHLDLSVEEIIKAVQLANAKIFERGTNDSGLTGMGTTFVGLGFVGNKLYITSVGDSRAYRVRAGKSQQLTEDHTFVMELLKSGAITPDQVANHPVSHMLTRSLGPQSTVDVDCWICQDGPINGDYYMLCSDGLYNLVSGDEIASIIEENDPEIAVQTLIEVANERGGHDNITVIVVQVGDGFPEEAIEYSKSRTEGSGASEQDLDATVDVQFVSEEDQSVEPQLEVAQNQSRSEERGEHPHKQPSSGSEFEESENISHGRKINAGRLALFAAAQRSFRRWGIPTICFTAIVGLAVVGGAVSQRNFGWLAQQTDRDVLPPVSPVPQIARIDVEVNSPPQQLSMVALSLPHLGAGLGIKSSVSEPTVAADTHLNDVPEHGLRDSTLRVNRRKEYLEYSIKQLDEKIDAFNKPLSGRAGQTLTEASRTLEAREKELEAVRADMDVATRKLTVWYGRQKRLESTDPVNLATEVAGVVESVREKKEVFERTTWTYLKEAEALRYKPADKLLAEKVAELAKVRKDRMKELSDGVELAITTAISESDKLISELGLKRDAIEHEIENLRREVEYVKILLGNDPQIRERKKQELIRERELAATELAELHSSDATAEAGK